MDKIKKILLALFVVLFIGSCAFFSLGMIIPGSVNAAEGAGKFPSLISDGKINSDFGDEFEAWFSKSFAYRGKIVDAFSYFRENVFKTGNDQVLVGRDGFLFFKDTVDSYTGLDPMTDDEISAAADALLNLQNYAKEHGASFIFAPAPNKATVYSDKMPGRYVKCTGETDLDRLFEALDSRGVGYVDLREPLIKAAGSALVYHKRDTHWNGLGAATAFEDIAGRLGVTVPDFGEPLTVHDFEGDLDALLYPGHTAYDDDMTYDFTGRFVYTSAYSNPMNMSISTRGEGSGKALVFRDSFGNALIPIIASSFGEVKFERANPYRIDLLNEFDADHVVLIIAERNISDLIGCDGRGEK